MKKQAKNQKSNLGVKGQAGVGITIFLVIVVIAVIVLVAGFDTVDASHRGVMVRFGEVQGEIGEGLHWTGVFTTTHTYDQRIRNAVIETSSTDKDGQLVKGRVAVNYKIKQVDGTALSLYRNVGRDDIIEERLILKDIIEEGFKQATVKYEAIEILENRQEVKELAITNIETNFPKDYFDIVTITVSDIDFSQQFNKAIEDKKTASQEKLKEEERLNIVVLQQQQEVEKFKAEAEKLRLQKSELNELLIQQQLIAKWDGKVAQTVIIGGEGENQNLLLQMATGGVSK